MNPYFSLSYAAFLMLVPILHSVSFAQPDDDSAYSVNKPANSIPREAMENAPQTNSNPPTPPGMINTGYIFGKQSGLTASSEEVRERKALMKRLSPDSPEIPDSLLEQTIISEKFFLSAAPVKPSQAELAAEYEKFRTSLPQGRTVSYPDVKAKIEMQLMLSKAENQAAVRARMQTMADDVKKKIEATRASEPASGKPLDGYEIASTWPVGKIQLDCISSDCIVFDPKTGLCVVSCDDFNQTAMTVRMPPTTPLDSVRGRVLDKSLNMAYYSRKAQESGLADDPDIQKAVSNKSAALCGQGLKSRAPNEKTLKLLYEAMYPRHFAEREVVQLDVVGSSDSLFVDSLSRLIARQDSVCGSGKGRKSNGISKNSVEIPWARSMYDNIPARLSTPTDTLKVGGVTKPIRTAFGFFIVRVGEVKIISETPFEKARDQLFRIAQGNRVISGTKADEKEATAYFKKHRNNFLSPDTLSLRLWLKPNQSNQSVQISDSGLSAKCSDTASFPSLSCISTALPPAIREIVEKTADTAKKDQVIGPIVSPFGTWTARITGRKRGGKPLEYADVADLVKMKIGARPQSLIELQPSECQSLIRNDILALAAWRKVVAGTPQPTEQEIDDAIKRKLISSSEPGYPADNPELLRQFVAKKLQENAWRNEQESWKSGLILNTKQFYQ